MCSHSDDINVLDLRAAYPGLAQLLEVEAALDDGETISAETPQPDAEPDTA